MPSELLGWSYESSYCFQTAFYKLRLPLAYLNCDKCNHRTVLAEEKEIDRFFLVPDDWETRLSQTGEWNVGHLSIGSEYPEFRI